MKEPRIKLICLSMTILMLFPVMGGSALFSQGRIQDIEKKLDLWLQKYPEEAVYVQTDRSFYSPGDRILIKAWVTDITGKPPEAFGRKLYMKLYDTYGLEVAGSEFSIHNNTVEGSLDIPKQIQNGNYMLSAYTGWMENIPVDKAFFKQLSVSDGKKDNLDVEISTGKGLCMPSSNVKLMLYFKGKDDQPVPAAFDYEWFQGAKGPGR